MNPIPPVTADDPEAKSADLVAENLAALKALLPQAFTEGGVDFEALRELLGAAVDEGDERYGLNWSGKRQARRLALTPSLGTLRPARDDSVDWDTTKNLIIEGDNLEVLKLLQKSYAGQVKLIFIDPPYNTGNDFVYPDDFTDSIGNYMRRTGQLGSDGAKNTSNPESSGRYHTEWLNMMLPRLMAAKNLLSNDGVIFVSIGDIEVSNTIALCRDVFGDENFLATIAWQKKYAVSQDDPGIGSMHDHIIVFRRSPEFKRNLLPRDEKQLGRYTNPDNDPRGPWAADNYIGNNSRYERPTLWYSIKHPRTGEEVWPKESAVWRYSAEKHAQIEAENRLYWGPTLNYERPRIKKFLNEIQDGVVPSSWWPFGEVGHNDEASKETAELIGPKVFSAPKPVRLIQRILSVGADKNGIVLDFFAGSGTTGQAVMAQNAADGGSRRFVLVQLPEPLDHDNKDQKVAADFCDSIGKPRNIAELTKERLRRAATKVHGDNPDATFDGGFRVYKLATSNLKAWAPGAGSIQSDIENAIDNLIPGRTEEDLMVELLLKQGIDLTEAVVTRDIGGRTVHAFGGGVLVVCLADITTADAQGLADGIAAWIEELNPATATTLFFKDTGFEDNQAKANLAAILSQRLGERLLKVRSL